MNRKFIFFDIDGTLVINEHIPLSTIQTIKKLQENSHIVGIATGRQISTTWQFAKQLNIDYIVSDGGYGITIHGKTIHIDPLEKDLVISLCDELYAKHIPFALTLDPTDHVVYASKEMTFNDPKKIMKDLKLSFKMIWIIMKYLFIKYL